MVFLIKHDVYYYKNVRLQTFMKLKTNVDYEMFNCNISFHNMKNTYHVYRNTCF